MNFSGGAYATSAPGIGAVYSSATTVAGDLAFYNYGGVANSRNEVMRIRSGFVGINTTNPLAGLQIEKYGSKFDSDSQYNQPSGNVFFSATGTIANQDNWIGIRGSYNSSSGSSNLLLQANYRDVNSQAGHYISSKATNFGAADFIIGKLVTSTSVSTPPTLVPQLYITSGGNVGIGTTSPTGLLHLFGTDPAFRIQNSGTGNMQFGQWDGTNNRIQSSGRDFLLTQTDSFNMLFHTNSTERMRITSGGGVGIGATSMWNNEILSVQRSSNGTLSTVPALLRLTNQGSGRVAKLLMTDSAIIDGIICMVPVNSTDSYFSLGFAGYSESGLVVRSNGNVGIGNTSPSSPLSFTNTTGNKIDFYNDGVNRYTAQINGGELRFYTSSTADVVSLYAGNVIGLVNRNGSIGVGTATPATNFNVVKSDNGGEGFARFEANNRTQYVEIGWNSINQWAVTPTNALFAFQINGTERMRITNGGFLGINTSSPQDRLDVNGSIRFRGNTPNFTAILDNAVLDYVPTSIFATDPCIRMAAIGTASVGADIRFLTGTSTTIAERMRISSSGNVGINGTTSSYTFYVNGTSLFGAITVGSLGTGTVYSNAGFLTNTNPSDRKLKTNIIPLTYGLADILKLNPVSYNWKDGTNGKQFGFIAQEVQEIMPDAVKDGEYLGLEKDAIYSALVNSVKELNKEIELLKSQIK